MLIALSVSVSHAATITVSVNSSGGGDFFGDGAITSATLLAADGDTIELIEGGEYTNGDQTITLDGSKSLTFRSTTAKWATTLRKSNGGSPFFQLEGDAGDVTYNFENIQIINDRPSRGGEALTFRQHTTNTMAVSFVNCRLEGSEGLRFEGPADSDTVSAPISITIEDSEIYGHTNNAFSTGSWGGNEPHQNITLTATNSLFSADDGTGFATPGEEEKGDNAFIWQSGRPFMNNSITLENCTLISNLDVWRMNGNADNELADNTLVFRNVEFISRQGGGGSGIFQCNYGNFNNPNNTFTFDRCSIIATSGTAQTRGLRINIGEDNATTPTVASTVNIFNSIVMSGGSTTSTLSAVSNGSTPLFLEGTIDANIYHNNIGHRDSGQDAVGYALRIDVAPSNTIDFQNNILYNLGSTPSGATTDTIIRFATAANLIEDSNLIIGTTNSTTLVTNTVFENVADPVEGVDIGENFLTLSTGASASAVDVANTPGNAAVASAVSLLDRDSILRYEDSPGWDIGAYELNPVPVELGAFELE